MPADLLSHTQLLSGSLAALPGTPLTTVGAAVSGNGVDLGAGGALPAGTPIPLVARVLVTAASQTSGGGTLTFTIDHSSDNSTWQTLAGSSRGANDIITLSATVQTAEIFIGFYTHQRYVRLTLTVGASGVGNSIAFTAQFMPSFP